MIETRVYLYDSSQESNGYRGEDLSNYVLQGNSAKEDITQELDTYELTLNGYPTRKEFAPETKLIIDVVDFDIVNGQKIDNTINTYHACVDNDNVTQPILSNDEYFNHEISFYEPSVIAQKRLVDNISATYKLKYVDLKTTPNFNLNRQATEVNTPSSFVPSDNWGTTGPSGFVVTHTYYRWGKYFEFEEDLQMLPITATQEQNDLFYKDVNNFYDSVSGTYKAKFKLPKLAIYFGAENTKTFNKIGYASIDYTIQQFSLTDENTPEQTWNGTIHSNSNFTNTAYSFNVIDNFTPTQEILNHWLCEKAEYSGFGPINVDWGYIKQYSQDGATPNYFSEEIEILPDKLYKVTISLHNYSNNVPVQGSNGTIIKLFNETPTKIVVLDKKKFALDNTGIKTITTPLDFYNNLSLFSNYQTFSTSSTDILLRSSVPYSALSLIQKAIINSGTYEKVENTYIGDLNARQYGVLISNVPFYIDENYITELATTQVIENFYNQKNLWEVLVEVGNYIHAIPEIKFGEDDRFMITFNKLGRTEQFEDKSTKLSIMNFNSVEDYISACSSYITNMVQLDGKIEEWVAPKTSNNEYLVYNDNAEIIVSKPIIELLDITIIANKNYNFNNVGHITVGQIANFTPFVFEENVYHILSTLPTDVPNRGYSMYYKLGDNKIMGGDYRTPTASSGDDQNDYAFKKAIFSAYFGYTADLHNKTVWSNIYVNDFTFKVTYRTKDSVRQNQTRPDLRKYLLNSKYDKVPEHNQFNNQTDVVVDSSKFGNMIFGKLIRTGNSQYKMNEWHTQLADIKHKGELYNIDGELYYVAKAQHIFLSNCIVSEIFYSKDYNQLSQVIGIPSEPRFYEISEQSSIKREVAINDYLLLTDDTSKIDTTGQKTYLKTVQHLAQLMFGGENGEFAKYVITAFKGDKDADNLGNNTLGEINFYKEVLSPINAYSSENTLTYEWDMVDNFSAGNKITKADVGEYVDHLKDVKDNAYRTMRAVQYTDTYGKSALMDFLILEDVPNFTQEQIMNLPENPFKLLDDAEITLAELSRTSTYIECSITTNYVFNEESFTHSPYYAQILYGDDLYAVYKAPSGQTYQYITYIPFDTPLEQEIGNTIDVKVPLGLEILATNIKDITDTNYNSRGIGLIKDCREVISINYNEQLLTSSDTFIVSPFLFKENKENVKLVLLTEEVNKLSFGYIDDSKIIIPYNTNNIEMQKYFDITPIAYDNSLTIRLPISTILANVNEQHFGSGDTMQKIKAYAIVYDVVDGNQQTSEVYTPSKTQFIIARNLPEQWTKQQCIADLTIGTPNKNTLFTKKQ